MKQLLLSYLERTKKRFFLEVLEYDGMFAEISPANGLQSPKNLNEAIEFAKDFILANNPKDQWPPYWIRVWSTDPLHPERDEEKIVRVGEEPTEYEKFISVLNRNRKGETK